MRENHNHAASARRQLAAIAIPTLGQLIAEPIFVLIDTALVGRIGDIALAGLSIGSTIILTSVGLCLFLAYSTTAKVSMLMGAGRTRDGLQAGVAGMWLALGIGIALMATLVSAAYPLSFAMGAQTSVLDGAVVYVQTASLGIPGTLMAYAANGMLRGLKKPGITLWSAISGALINVILDVVFIFGLGWGVMGSGIATCIAQWVMCIILLAYLAPVLRRNKISLKPLLSDVKDSAGDGAMLFVRTAAIRVGMVATVMVATAMGTTVLASYQAVNSSWNLALNILDAIGVGGQALIGTAIGAKDIPQIHSLLKEIEYAGIRWGVYVGVGFALFGWFAAPLFTTEPSTAHIIAISMIVVGIFFPYHGWLWALDGVLIGAGDFAYLAKACTLAALVHVCVLVIAWRVTVAMSAPPLVQSVALWLVFNIVFMGVRGLGNILRAHKDTWIYRAIAQLN
ncbi:MATE family efflux transporter [Alloscardovia venturai]|uniref:MATE family efflux transporter n=2 Tax=Alloscardovia venturai TaxID=1769421 RepID=A0ABW2Y4L9_9BIFI